MTEGAQKNAQEDHRMLPRYKMLARIDEAWPKAAMAHANHAHGVG